MKTFLLIIVLVAGSLIGQDTASSKLDYNIPRVYTTVTIGSIENSAITLRKKVSDNILASLKWGLFSLNSSSLDYGLELLTTHSAWGAGVGVNYFFNKMFLFRYTGIEYIFIIDDLYSKGFGIQWVLGNSTNFEKGFGITIEWGVVYSSAYFNREYPKPTRKDKFGAVFKLGISYSFLQSK